MPPTKSKKAYTSGLIQAFNSMKQVRQKILSGIKLNYNDYSASNESERLLLLKMEDFYQALEERVKS